MRILFLFIGETHHLLHSLPIAAELQEVSPQTDICIAVPGAEYLPIIERLTAAYPLFRPQPVLLKRGIGRRRHRSRLLTLFQNLRFLRSFDAIVVPERTTTIIRHFLGRNTRLIFTPHGAGDRAIMLDPRDRFFDFVLVAGNKSEQRLLEAGTITPGHYCVNGYVKMDFMKRIAKTGPRLFDNDRPVVVYTPHFRTELSSWPRFGRDLIGAFSRQERYNLVVAPHMRLFHGASQAARDEILSLAVPGKILIDLDSPHLTDMTYTMGADIYVGDVSSQVYEFLLEPRPCIFLDAHDTDWRDNPDYRFWTLGDVASNVDDLMRAIDRAPERHSQYRNLQIEAFADSVGGDPSGAAERGARAILEYLDK